MKNAMFEAAEFFFKKILFIFNFKKKVIMYVLLCGYPPFQGKDDDEIIANSLKEHFLLFVIKKN